MLRGVSVRLLLADRDGDFEIGLEMGDRLLHRVDAVQSRVQFDLRAADLALQGGDRRLPLGDFVPQRVRLPAAFLRGPLKPLQEELHARNLGAALFQLVLQASDFGIVLGDEVSSGKQLFSRIDQLGFHVVAFPGGGERLLGRVVPLLLELNDALFPRRHQILEPADVRALQGRLAAQAVVLLTGGAKLPQDLFVFGVETNVLALGLGQFGHDALRGFQDCVDLLRDFEHIVAKFDQSRRLVKN